MTTNTIIAEVDAFVTAQNKNRGGVLAGSGTLPLDYDALTGSVPSGGNAVTGISGVAAGAAPLSLPSGQAGNAVIIDGGISASASTSGPDSYSFSVDTSGVVTMTDNNTGNSETISHASYLVFNGGATTSSGAYQSAYLVESGTSAQIASMYNAAFQRVPDFPGLEFYAIPIANGSMTLHQAATYFLASPEFATHYPALTAPADNGGPNDQAFITQLYGQILHRTPMASEVNFYVQDLQGKLSGQTAPDDRAQLLIYFSASPENQADISASKGGWLINPVNGATNLGALSQQAANTVLANETASGTINAADFSGLASNGSASVHTSAGTTVSLYGANYIISGNVKIAHPGFFLTADNVTIDLTSQYYNVSFTGAHDTINGVSTGGSLIGMPSSIGGTQVNNGGTVNLFGSGNVIGFGNWGAGSVTVAGVINGWSSGDYFGSNFGGTSGTVYQGSAASPVSGAAIGNNQGFGNSSAINVGTLTDDSASTMVAAANLAYKVGEISGEHAYFFGEDPQGNTMVFFWRGDQAKAGSIVASDITGAVELVGVHASSLTGANFH